MKTIKANSAADAWVKAILYLEEKGKKSSGLIEVLNLCIEITNFFPDSGFDKKFRQIFGDERIDYAASVTFIEPKKVFDKYVYKPMKDSYFERMCKYRGEFNQIEQCIKILKTGANVKRCEVMVYDPLKDAKRMFKQPCLLAIDLKPRGNYLYLTAFFRSQRVSKSGYADYTALINLGDFLAGESDRELRKVTVIAASSHLSNQNKELDKSRRLLNAINTTTK